MQLQQQLHISVHERPEQHIEAVLEADPAAVRLALLAMGQTAARLVWDGQQLHETRAPWLPAAVSAERILSDLQLAYWPVAAIQAALPAGWTLLEAQGVRTLRADDEVVVTVDYPSAQRLVLANLRKGYRLVIDSHDMGAAPNNAPTHTSTPTPSGAR